MSDKISNSPQVALSVRAYQLLLKAYPAKFRQEYGSHMAQVFRDCCLRAVRQSGRNGLVRLWGNTLLDLIQSVISERMQKEVEMKREMKPEDIRMAGWALMVGAAVFAITSVLVYVGDAMNVDLWMLPSILIPFFCMPLFLVGVLAIRNRYGEKVGELAKNILLIGAVLGTVISVIGLLAAGIGELWLLVYTGPAVLFVGLSLFGIVALYKKPLSRWNILPLLAGIWYPILFFPQLSFLFNGYFNTGNDNTFSTILVLLQCVALIMLGHILKSDVPEEMAPA